MSKKRTIALIMMVLLIGLVASCIAAKEPPEKLSGGWLGVYLQDISPDMKDAMDLKSTEGVLVTDVVGDSPAEKAGLKGGNRQIQAGNIMFTVGGDVITQVDQFEVKNADDLIKHIRERKPGEVVTLKVLRDDQFKDVKITLQERPRPAQR